MRCANYLMAALLPMLMPVVAWAADKEGGSDVEKLMPKVAPAIFNLLMFLLLFAVLAKFVWPRILEALQAREKKLHDDLHGAQAARDKAEALKTEFEQKIAEAHAETRKLLDQARADAEQFRSRRESEIESEMSTKRQRALDEIELARQQALADLHAHAAELAVAVAGKVIGRQIEDADTQRLVDESLAELNRLN